MDLNSANYSEGKVMTPLRERASSSVKWSSISKVGRQAIQMLTMIILARILAPSDFGLVSMATVIIAFLAIFIDLGTSAAVIQKKNLDESFVSSVFWINVFSGFLMTIVLIVLAPLISKFYREPQVNPLLICLAFNFLISALGKVQQAVLERTLAFQTLAKIEMSAILSGSFVAIAAAFGKAGVWSLVYQLLVTTVIKTILVWCFTFWKPKLIFKWQEIRSVMNYSLHLLGYGVIDYFHLHADYILIGYFLGARSLGYYFVAYRIISFLSYNISGVLGRVMFPLFAQVQDDHARFRRVYLDIVQVIAWIAFPLMMGLMILSDSFIAVIFGSKWAPVSLLVVILAPVGISKAFGTTVGPIYQAKGRTDWMFRWGVFVTFIVMIAFFVGLRWGIIGIAAAYTATLPLAYPGFAIPFKLIHLPMREFGRVLWKPCFCSFVMMGVLFMFKLRLGSSFSHVFILASLIPLGVSIYLLMNFLINQNQMRKVWSMTVMAVKA